MFLAEVGLFSGPLLALGALGVSLAGWRWVKRVRLHGAGTGAGLWRTLPTALLAPLLALALAVPPGEYLIEGADGSAYTAIGRNLVRTGALVWSDPLLPLIPPDIRPSIFETRRDTPHVLDRFPGGFTITDDGDTVRPEFFHLLPIWLAAGELAFGQRAPYWINIGFGTLSVLLVYLIGRRMWSGAAGVTSAVLLAANFAQIWFARVPTAEMLMQFFLLSSVFLSLQAWDQRSPAAGAAAGIAGGLAAFVRIDALVVPLLAFAWLAWVRRKTGRAPVWTAYAVCLALFSAHAAVHTFTVARLYTLRILAAGWRNAAGIGGVSSVEFAAAAALTGLVGVLMLRRRAGRLGFAVIAVLAIGLLAARAPSVTWLFVRLLSPLGLVTALIGLAVLVARQPPARAVLLAVPFGIHAALILLWGEVVQLPDDFRRFVPVLLPFGLIGSGVFIAAVGASRGWTGRLVWLLPAGLCGMFAVDSWPVLRSPAMQRVHEQIADLASDIPSGAIVLTDGFVPGHLALALQSAFDRPAARLPRRVAESGHADRLFRELLDSGRPVVLAVRASAGDATLRLDPRDLARLSLTRFHVSPLHLARLEPTVGRFPSEVWSRDVAVHLYRVEPATAGNAPEPPFLVDVGGADYAHVLSGFHDAEHMPPGTARWTMGRARLLLAQFSSRATPPATLVLRITAGRQPAAAPVTVRVSVGDIALANVQVSGGPFETYEIALPTELRERLVESANVVTIDSDTFVPANIGLGADERVLGIAVDWILLR